MKEPFEKLVMVLVAALTFGATGGEVTATAMTAQQRYPWNGLVDITVTLSGTSNDAVQVACRFVATNSATHAALNVLHVTGGSEVSGSGSTWTRQFVWDAAADLGEVKIADVELSVEAKPNPLGGVQLWEDGPYWAECNVGATKPEECGYYFWWGDTVGYSVITNRGTWSDDYYYWTGVKWVSSKWARMRRSPFSSTICPTCGKTKAKLKSAGYIDSTGNLVAAHDAATAHLGAPWRMPTDADFADLISMCDMNWEICNGVWGLRVTGKDAYVSKSIFLPAAGYGEDSDLYDLDSYGSYWSSTPRSSSNAWGMDFDSSDFYWGDCSRDFGESVRPVRGYATFGPVFSAAMTHVALDTRTGTRYAQDEELLAFSTAWSAGVTQLVLTVDGVNVLTTTSATNGVYVWKPDLPMTRIVTLELTTCGAVNETLTATFGATGGEEPGGEVTATAVTAQQQYPCNGLVDITVTLSGASNDAARAACMFVATNSATHATLNVLHVTGDSVVSGSGNTWTRRFVWDAKADIGEVNIADVELAVEAKPLGGVQLWAGGPYWAECNVGATKPEECGFYFWWGDTVGYSANTNGAISTDDPDGDCWEGVKWVSSEGAKMRSSPFSLSVSPTDYLELRSAGYIDSTDNLVAAYDAATAHLGAPWRMPTGADFADLKNKCDMACETCNGVRGMRVTGKGAYASKSIFLPAVGYGEDFDLYDLGSYGSYWSSSCSDLNAWGMDFDSSDFYWSEVDRSYGQSVRPVRGYATFGLAFSAATTHLALDTRTEPGGEEPGGEVTATAMTAQQRYPWNGLVDITVTLSGASNDAAHVLCTFVATNSATHAALNVSHVSGDNVVSGSGGTWMRRFVWDATADIGEVKIADLELAVEAKPNPLGGVQLWEGGPHWAECNVGASNPEEYGYYFWWGGTVGYGANTNGATWTDGGFADGDYWDGVEWVSSEGAESSSSPFALPTDASRLAQILRSRPFRKTISELQSAGYIDSTGNLVAAYDAATAHLGAPWRMPTAADFAELISKCDTTWETCNGVWGRRVTGRGDYASRSIFLPAAGYDDGPFLCYLGSSGCYWSSTPDSNNENYAWDLELDSSAFCRGYIDRNFGQSVRPVRGFAMFGLAFSAATTHVALDTRIGTRCAQAEELIAFGTDWNVGVTQLVLTVNGVNVLTATSPTNGVYIWKPDLSTSRTVTLEHTTCGTVNETLTAAFDVMGGEEPGGEVTGGEVTATAMTAQQRYPWNGLVDITVTLSGTSNDAAQVACRFVATNSATHAALDVLHVTGGSVVSGSGSTWTRQFVWDAAADIGEVKIADLELAVEAKRLDGVQLWENGPYWAECNVGATQPEEYGYYFWWGDTIGYSANTNGATWIDSTSGGYWDGVTWVSSKGDIMSSSPFSSSTCPTYDKTIEQLQSAGYIDSRRDLLPAHDAATAHLGVPWRMPTLNDVDGLISKCYMTWETCNGVWGLRVTGKGAYLSKSIFLPAAGDGDGNRFRFLGSEGYYWDATYAVGIIGKAWAMHISSGDFSADSYYRRFGQSVRPVRGFATLGLAFSAATTHLALDTRTGTRCVQAEELIAFSTDWDEGVTQLVLTVDGVNVLTTTSPTNGVYVWKPDQLTTRVAMLELTTCGTVNETLIATFGATDGAVTATAVTAQQRYPWNGLVDITVTLSGTSNDAARAVCTFVATNCATGAALDVSHVTGGNVVSGGGNTWTQQFVWDAAADIGEVKIADLELAVAAKQLDGVQLWEGGPYWAECNVGASKPEECGYCFWWGDTIGYSVNTNSATSTDGNRWEGVKWVSSKGDEMSGSPFRGSACPTYDKTSAQLQAAGYIDSTGNLVAAHDAATAHLGAPWRMPTGADCNDLKSKCDTTWETCNGVWGRRVTGRGVYSSKSIFLPAAGEGYNTSFFDFGAYGDYWDAQSGILSVSSNRLAVGGGPEYNGLSVRPVRGFATHGLTFSAATTHLALDTRTETRGVQAEEPIVFSTDWNEGVTQLVLTVDGVDVLTTTSPTNGVYVWKPDLSTTRTITLTHTTYGTENETLTATFTTVAYDVTFSAGAHGALVSGIPATQRVLHGEAAVPPEVVPAAGYRFTGWSADTSNVMEDIKVTALYEAISYTITYEDLHGATHANPSTYTIEDGVTFSAPSAIPQRQFVRWEPASIAAGSTGAVTVRARWGNLTLYVDAAKGNDAWDGSSAGQAVKTLAKAYALADAGDVILVAAGTYDPVTATGKAVTFRGADGATIDGNDKERCVTADDDVVFENFILQNGYDYFKGGGVCGGTFERCTIRDCYSGNSGGGAYDAILRHCVIVNNWAWAYGGGAIGGTLVGCVIVGNTAKYGYGGGVYGGTLVGCVVKDNNAGYMVGGGVYEPESLSDTTFSGNSPEDTPDVGGTMKAGGTHLHVPSGSETIYVIPHDWFLATGLAKAGDSATGLDAKMTDVHANGYTGWESYVAGLSPNDPTSQFRAVIAIADGKVGISWTPDLNSNGVTRIYTVFGRTDLAPGGVWGTPLRPWHRFYKIEVAMPTSTAGEKSAVAGEGFALEEESRDGVQLWENGPYWAECNVGATKPGEYGYYFWWGDTIGYKRSGGTWTDDYIYFGVTWVSSKGEVMGSSPFSSSTCPTQDMTESQLQSAGYIDSTGNLVAAHDAATAHLGAPWRMPTAADFADLKSKCDTTLETCNGVWGRRVTGRGAYSSKSIFLPAAGAGVDSRLFNYLGSEGNYRSSTPFSGYYGSMCLIFDTGNLILEPVTRDAGLSVRPVRDSAQ